MDKKAITELRPVIRSAGQDFKTVKAAFDALFAVSSLKSSGSAELLALAEHEFTIAVSAIRSRINQIVAVTGCDGLSDIEAAVDQDHQRTYRSE